MSKRVTTIAWGVVVMTATATSASPVHAQQTEPVISQGASSVGPRAAPAPVPASKLDDAAGTTDANAVAAAKADAQTRRIIADKQAYDASVDTSIAGYDAKMEAYRQQVRENEARNAEIRRRNDARAALYKACVAGDKAACTRYNAGQ